MKLKVQDSRVARHHRAADVVRPAETESLFHFDAEGDVPEEVKALWKADTQNRSGASGTGRYVFNTFLYAVSLPRRRDDLLLGELSKKMQDEDFTLGGGGAVGCIPFLFPERLRELKAKLGDPNRLVGQWRAYVRGNRVFTETREELLRALLLMQVFPEVATKEAELLNRWFLAGKAQTDKLRGEGKWGAFTEMAAFSRLAFPERFSELQVTQADCKQGLREGNLIWRTALEPGAARQGLTSAFALTVLSAGEIRLSPGSAVQIIPARPKIIHTPPLPERPV